MDIDWHGAAGVFLTRQALADGMDEKTLTRAVRSGELHRIRRGAFVAGEIWRAASPEDRHRLTARAVLATSHPSSALSHTSAVIEHGAATYDTNLSEIHLSRTDGGAGRREAGVVHHRGDLDDCDVTLVNGLRVVKPTRACLELMTITHTESALVSTNSMLGLTLTTTAKLIDARGTMQHWPHGLRSHIVLRLADKRNRYAGEARSSYLCWDQHLPAPVPQYVVTDDDGHTVAILDFCWPLLGVFMEFDGAIKYERLRREGESLEDVIRREKRREEMVCAMTGWVCIRVTWEDLARPVTTARRINNLLESRRPHAS